MPIYVYRAVTKSGLIVKNRVEEPSKQVLLKKIKNNNLIPIDIIQTAYKSKSSSRIKKKNTTSAQEIMKYANHYLPEDIRILAVSQVPDRFHARLSAVWKTYCYHIDTGSKKDVFERKYTYGFPFSLDVEKMRQAARLLEGTHDFKSFCGNKKMKKSTVRTIWQIHISREGTKIAISYTGDGFLQYMVRILTGTLLEIGLGKRSPESVTEILYARERGAAGFTAPPEGLFLVSVGYSLPEFRQDQQSGPIGGER